jgi:hypothetical protein
MNELERQVMEFLLRGDHPILEALRLQLAASSVASREMTGVGFFTNFEVPSSVARIRNSARMVISDVHAEIDGLSHGAGFLLFVTNGCLDFLEAFIYEDKWPVDARLKRLYYLRPQRGESGDLVELVETAHRDLQWQNLQSEAFR